MFADQLFESTLQFVVDSAQASIADCWMAGMTLLERQGPTTAVATTVEAGRVDALQYEYEGGPCLEAYRQQAFIRIESTQHHDRWPEFCRGAFEAGIRSTLSFPLIVSGDGLGALNLYSDRESGFDELAERVGGVFANHASVTLANARAYWRNEALRVQLEEALETRGIIDQAKGILMAQGGLSADEAFEVLRRASQRTNRKLHGVAKEIVEAPARRRGKNP